MKFTKESINIASERIAPYIHHTPIFTSSRIDNLLGAHVFFKCENFQKVGAFKMRGASNAVFSLSETQARRGVVTHSSGNHAQALALAAQMRGIDAHIIMPENSPQIKIRAVRNYGGKIYFCDNSVDAREKRMNEVKENTKSVFIHPYDNPQIILGQATAAKELIDSVNDIGIIITPVGGGGLLAGTALSAQYFGLNCVVIAAEPAGADDARRSFLSGRIIPSRNPKTIADGLLTSLGETNFPIIHKLVEDVITVDESSIVHALKVIYNYLKIIVEPSSAVALAALFSLRTRIEGKKIGLMLSGGNMDPDKIPW